MGEGFIKKRAGTFRKKQDKDRLALVQKDLLTVEPECGPAIALARLDVGAQVSVNERVTIERDGERLTLNQGGNQVGHFVRPPAELTSLVRSLFGIVPAMIVRVNPISGTAQIAVCSQ